jgi:hypothetical protein
VAQGTSTRCAAHGGGRRCVAPECGKVAQGTSTRCAAHGGGRRCVAPECGKVAQGTSTRCAAHGGGRRCPNCVTWLDARTGSEKYDGYCATCFKRTKPDDPRSTRIYTHTKEVAVRNMINQYFDGFTHDEALYTGGCDCTHRRRIDHRKLIGGTMLAVETDEFAHRGYGASAEELRYDDLFMVFSGKWIWVRFNPDDNRDKTDFVDKLATLRAVLARSIREIENGENVDLVYIVKLFY